MDVLFMISELKTEIAKLNAEVANKNAELIETETKLREVERDRKNEVTEFRKENLELSANLASKTMEVGVLTSYKNRTAEQDEELAKQEVRISEQDAVIGEMKRINASKDARIDAVNREFTDLKTDYEKMKVGYENVRNDRNDLSVKARASEEKALNETRERSRIELDNADLLDKQRELTAEISNMAERISVGATQKLEQEKALSKVLEENRKLKESHEAKLTEFRTTLEEAKKFHSWAWGKLKEAGYAVIEG